MYPVIVFWKMYTFYLQNNSMNEVLLLSSFCRYRNGSTKVSSNFPMDSQLINRRGQKNNIGYLSELGVCTVYHDWEVKC
jgi:hypothetical protein